MSDMYAVEMEDMPKIFREFVQDEMELSAVPDAVINEQSVRSAELGLNPSDDVVREILEQVRVAFRLASTELAGKAAFNLWNVYHGTAQAMKRLGATTVTKRVGLEMETMALEVLRKIMIAQLGDEAGS